MTPPIYQLVAASTDVQALLGLQPAFYGFGEAPQGRAYPYAVWQQVYGTPENYMGQRPDIDSHGVQVDCYSMSQANARAIGMAISEALEPAAYIVSWNGEARDETTRVHSFSFTVEFLTPR